MIPFNASLLDKGYTLIYRNGERPEDYKVWPDGSVTTYHKDGMTNLFRFHYKDGVCLDGKDYDLFLIPPEMYVGVYEDDSGFTTTIPYDNLEDLKAIYEGYDYYRLVPVEEPSSRHQE